MTALILIACRVPGLPVLRPLVCRRRGGPIYPRSVVLFTKQLSDLGPVPRAHVVVDKDVDGAVDGLASVADGACDLESVLVASGDVVVGQEDYHHQVGRAGQKTSDEDASDGQNEDHNPPVPAGGFVCLGSGSLPSIPAAGNGLRAGKFYSTSSPASSSPSSAPGHLPPPLALLEKVADEDCSKDYNQDK